MSQYPNEKSGWVQPRYADEKSGWVQPPDAGPNGAPGTSSQSQYYASPPPQGYYPPPAPPPPQEYYPSPPPPDYGYAVSHPEGRPANEYKPPHEAAPDAGSSSSSAQEGKQGGIMMSLGSFFGNKGTPPMWNRPPQQQLPYNAFPPMCLISNGNSLSSGFPELPPPCQLNPHPFGTHDVTEEDWKRFLADVKKAGSLSPAQRIKSNVIPLVTGMSLVTGFVATFAIEKRMKSKNRNAAGDLVDHWNHYFFGPRRMEVVLCQASERLSGRVGAAPVGGPNQERMANGLRRRGDDSVSDDSSSDGDDRSRHGHTDRHARRAAKREARRARRAERRERKARGENKQPYELFITAV